MSSALDSLKALRQEREVERDREELPKSLLEFCKKAWYCIHPDDEYWHNWHIEAICEHLEAVSREEIKRLQIWIPPQSMKTLIVSIFWPAWEWTTKPSLKYWTASYATSLSWQNAAKSRELLNHRWYRERWGDKFKLTRDAEHYFLNDHGGHRLSTAPGASAGTGYHGHRIIIDDPIWAAEAETDTLSQMDKVNSWYDGTVYSRGLKPEARVIIMQRLHERDLCGHLSEREHWDVLCLPERYEGDHPYAWRGERVHPSLRDSFPGGDPRDEGDLLWPSFRDEEKSLAMEKGMGRFRSAAQMQQRPAAREGELLLRSWWRFYDPRHRGLPAKLPVFQSILISVDTPLKDNESNDNVAIQCWGVKGADRYLLDIDLGKMNYLKAKRRISEMARWARNLWRVRQYILIENTGYGVELYEDLKRDFTGCLKIKVDGDKVMRAEAASDVLESGNVFLPGYGPPWRPAYDEAQTPAEVAAFIHSCALFPNAAHDDDVDAWSQAMNWLRTRRVAPMRVSSVVGRIR